MHLNVREAASLLRVSERTLYRWLRQGEVPAHKVQDQYRFNRVELLEWATREQVAVSPEIFHEPGMADAPLAEALQRGGIWHRVAGHDRDSVLRAVAACLPLPAGVDRDFLFAVLQTSRSRSASAIRGGIALPHVRHPLVLDVAEPQVSLCYLADAVDFGAKDGQLVHALFVIVSPNVRSHLLLLARLMFLLQDARLRACLEQGAKADEVLTFLRELEQPLRSAVRAARET